LKLELNDKSSSRKYANNWEMNNILLKDKWIADEIKKKINRYMKVNEN
jgi:hypothetical protein